MKPIYICVNGHTFDQPITGNIMGVYGGLRYSDVLYATLRILKRFRPL